MSDPSHTGLAARRNPPRFRGQSLVEFALLLPPLLMLLSGMVEFGFGLNQYINIVEAAREGARYGSDGQPDPDLNGRDLVSAAAGQQASNMDCTSTTDFYAKIACVVQQSAAPITLNPATDDIVITVARVYRSPLCDQASPPAGLDCVARILPDPDGLWPDPALDPAPGEVPGHWTWQGNAPAGSFTRARIQAYLDANALSTGVLIVEVYYRYHLVLNLPWLQPFLDPTGEGIPFYTYTIIPVPAGEPRPTPTPTFTPTPTWTNSPTPTITPTPGPSRTLTPVPPTATATPTPTRTPLPSATPVCVPGYASAANSTLTFVTARSWPDYGWADNTSTLRLQLMLMGECAGEALDGRSVTLVSDRGTAVDTLKPESVVGNLYFFTIASNKVGNSTLSAATEICPASDPRCAGKVNTTVISLPLTRPAGHFVCVLGSRDVSTSANNLQIMYVNPSPSGSFAWPPYVARRLVRLAVAFPTSTPALQITSISFGSSSNVVWTGAAVTGPSASFGDGTSLPWTSPNRTMTTQYRPLQISFNLPITPGSGSWTYQVTATWDDTAGGSVCTSETISITLP